LLHDFFRGQQWRCIVTKEVKRLKAEIEVWQYGTILRRTSADCSLTTAIVVTEAWQHERLLKGLRPFAKATLRS
jgi:hypothetical protein